ncbi:adenine-specific DNA-methyltransferase [Deinococcus sp. HSC-46F16]|uniref:site-specific DNA-methyltransferase n=1 Tax=Deinococcus sp. HSC-46F16 TaxID=2910968 RepID=UPI0020A121A4|nr:site-specific DNA-methyltransferase [Deinococcus sp. HSC-46F16]MCP2013412.1 adenine-specific DNA-methyltransferase [Deinococcus sp. HSC-46F16]
MPTLDWIGKQAVLTHHNDIPYRTLVCDQAQSFGDPDSGNLIVHGDNLEALKALMPSYAGQVKLIYIDPPYNTGNEEWVYNDNVNSPELEAWLGKVVGKDFEDLSRQDKWLCMMYPRLHLLKQLLRDDGVIVISLDDNTASFARMLLDEVFLAQNHLATFIWRKVDSPNTNGVSVAPNHEYLYAYAGRKAKVQLHAKPDPQIAKAYGNLDDQGRRYRDRLLKKNGSNSLRSDRPTMYFGIPGPDGEEVFPVHDDGREARWAAGPKKVEELRTANLLVWKRRVLLGREQWVPYTREYAPDNPERPHPTIWDDLTTMRQAKAHQRDLFLPLGLKPFDTPKPEELLARLIEMTTQEGDLVLDSFAGSGTTGAVAHKMNRRYILVELTPSAREYIVPRLRKVVQGEDPGGVSETFSWEQGGGFRFCDLGPQLFNELGQVADGISFAQMARYIFLTQTGRPLPADAAQAPPFIGTHDGRDYFLLLNDTLRAEHLTSLGDPERPRTVFADATTLSASALAERHVTFKQVPYEVRL